MKIEKPKKNANGTYEGLIYANNKKQPVNLSISNAKVVHTKLHNEDWYLYIQHPSVAKEVSLINSEVIQNVKDNCSTWFRNALTDDLIEDYFTSNIVFDKDLGQVIKFKCLNDISDLESNTFVNLEMALKKIRFFKQKFIIEWDIEEIEVIDPYAIIDLDDAEELEDIPMPMADEIESMKQASMEQLETRTRELNIEIDLLRNMMSRLKSVTSMKDMMCLQDELDKILFS